MSAIASPSGSSPARVENWPTSHAASDDVLCRNRSGELVREHRPVGHVHRREQRALRLVDAVGGEVHHPRPAQGTHHLVAGRRPVVGGHRVGRPEPTHRSDLRPGARQARAVQGGRRGGPAGSRPAGGTADPAGQGRRDGDRAAQQAGQQAPRHGRQGARRDDDHPAVARAAAPTVDRVERRVDGGEGGRGGPLQGGLHRRPGGQHGPGAQVPAQPGELLRGPCETRARAPHLEVAVVEHDGPQLVAGLEELHDGGVAVGRRRSCLVGVDRGQRAGRRPADRQGPLALGQLVLELGDLVDQLGGRHGPRAPPRPAAAAGARESSR